MLELRHLLLPLALTAFLPVENPAIVIRHDRPDSAYVALGTRYADVLAHVEERAEGTVIAPRWVLTAAHVVESLGPFDGAPRVTIGGTRYGVEKILIHPDWEGGWDDFMSNHDLALLKLERPVPHVRPIRLYRGDDEQGMIVTLLGRGKTGTGVSGQVGEKGMTVRGATNRIDGVSETALFMTFDIGKGATELEGAGGAGDSGGPALLAQGDTLFLVGVGSAGTGAKGYGMYGTLDIYTRVSGLADWIEETMATDPAPTAEWKRPIRASSEAPRWPSTSVGELAESFFETYASSIEDPEGDDWIRFYQRYGDSERPAEDRAAAVRQGLVEGLGRLEIYGWSTAGQHQIRVLVYAPESDVWRSIGLETSPTRPGVMTRLYMKWESPPKSEVWGR